MSLVKDMSEMLVNDRVSDELKAKRLAICEACDKMTKKTRQCRMCWCFVDSKTAAKRHFDIKKMRVVETHCDAGKW